MVLYLEFVKKSLSFSVVLLFVRDNSFFSSHSITVKYSSQRPLVSLSPKSWGDLKTQFVFFPAKRSSEAPASGKEEKRVEKLSSSITSVLSGFRDFCAIMWLMHVRDKMSKASRKYRQLRSQSTGSEEVSSVGYIREGRLGIRPPPPPPPHHLIL